MDVLLFVVEMVKVVVYFGWGDFDMVCDGILSWWLEKGVILFVYVGVVILYLRFFEGVLDGLFLMNVLFDRVIEQGCFFGVQMEGIWLYIGMLEVICVVEFVVCESVV